MLHGARDLCAVIKMCKKSRSHVRRYSDKQAGIVYCLTRKDTEVMSQHLQSLGIAAGHYHADIDPAQRQHVHQAWSNGKPCARVLGSLMVMEMEWHTH